jgi:hypothetical protein
VLKGFILVCTWILPKASPLIVAERVRAICDCIRCGVYISTGSNRYQRTVVFTADTLYLLANSHLYPVGRDRAPGERLRGAGCPLARRRGSGFVFGRFGCFGALAQQSVDKLPQH